VFAAGADPDTSASELQSYETAPSTTGEKPLIVVAPQQQQFYEAPPAGKRQKFLSSAEKKTS